MTRDAVLFTLTVAAATFSWWPAMPEPSLNLSGWIFFFVAPFAVALATTLSPGRWSDHVIASSVALYSGLCIGQTLFPPSDGLARAIVPVWNYIITAASSAAAVLAALMGRKLAAGTPGPRCTIWCVLACLVAFAPAALAITPPLVARRLARHDRLAEQRFRSLRQAFERARVRHADGASICDGVVLSRYYSGPPFSSEDCWRITGNYVKQDGYSFMIYCHGKNAYVLDARPFPGSGEGTRHFCADEFGQKCGELGWKTHPYVCPTCAE